MVVRCQNCGQENPDSHIFCDRCGAIILKPFNLNRTPIREPIMALRQAVSSRSQTDFHMPIALVLAPLMIWVGSLVAIYGVEIGVLSNSGTNFSNLSTLFAVLSVVTTAGSILSILVLAYVSYKLVKRQNDHYERERDLREAAMSLVKAATQTPAREQLVVGEMMTMGIMHTPVERRRIPWFWGFAVGMPAIFLPLTIVVSLTTNQQSDFLWVLFVLIVSFVAISVASLILQLIMFKFLGDTMFDHDQRWVTFTMSARRALSKLGFPPGRPFTVSRLPERSFWLYFLLSFVTGGIFYYYWLYALAKDPNDHFRYQWTFEDNMLSSVELLNTR